MKKKKARLSVAGNVFVGKSSNMLIVNYFAETRLIASLQVRICFQKMAHIYINIFCRDVIIWRLYTYVSFPVETCHGASLQQNHIVQHYKLYIFPFPHP